jgi:hypothetical protein
MAEVSGARPEKYTSWTAFAKARARRGVMRAAIRGLVSWERAPASREGYTVIIGCNHRLAPLAAANLSLLAKQDLTGADRVLVVFDAPREEMDPAVERSLRERHGAGLPLEVLYYTPKQARVARLFDWGWIYSWMSWSIGISHTRTRYAMLHDLDALLLKPTTLREHYDAVRAGDAEYLGVKYYTGQGLVPDDRLVTTFELMFDADFVRARFRPIDLFNNVRRFEGRRVEFDTFLYAQSVAGRRKVLPIDEEWMVHPSQMICQYVDHVNGRNVPAGTSNVLMIPYYFEVGGDPGPLRDVLGQFREGKGPRVRVFGRETDASLLTPAHARWYAKQAGRLERALHGETRPEIREYFDAIGACCGVREPAC